MALHHIIPWHEWKKRINPKATRSNKDFNAPDNVVDLTTEQHAQAHYLLYELNNNTYDLAAAQGISGLIGKEELFRMIIRAAHCGKPLSEETRRRISIGNTGKKRSPEYLKWMSEYHKGNQHWLGKHHTIETKQKLSAINTGKKHSEETKKRIGTSVKGHRRLPVGYKHSAATGIKMSMSRLGKKRGPYKNYKIARAKGTFHLTAETKKKIGDHLRGTKQPIVTCPYCQRSGGSRGMARFHFNNCKLKDTGRLDL